MAPLFGAGKLKKNGPRGKKKWPRGPGREGRRECRNGVLAGGTSGRHGTPKKGKKHVRALATGVRPA